MFTGLVIGSILRPAVLPSHGVQILPAQTAINKADDVSQHDRTPLFDRVAIRADSCFGPASLAQENGFVGLAASLHAVRPGLFFSRCAQSAVRTCERSPAGPIPKGLTRRRPNAALPLSQRTRSRS